MTQKKKNSFGRRLNSRHKSVVRMTGYALALKDEPAMWQLATVMYARLKPSERAFLALAAIAALDEDEWQIVVYYVETEI